MGRNERTVYMAQQTTELLHAVVHRNAEVAWQAMTNIDTRYGGEGVLLACRAVADVTRQVIYPGTERGDGSLRGSFLAIQRDVAVDVDPRYVWAAQFFAAHVNGDDATCAALFLAAIEDPQAHAGQVVAFMNLCAGMIRDAADL